MFLGVNFSHRGAPVSPHSHSLASVPQTHCWERSEAGVFSSFPWTLGRPGHRCAHLSISDGCHVACRRQPGLLGLVIKMPFPYPSSDLASTYLSFLNSYNSPPHTVWSTCIVQFPTSLPLLLPLLSPEVPFPGLPCLANFNHSPFLPVISSPASAALLLPSLGYRACLFPVPRVSWALDRHLQAEGILSSYCRLHFVIIRVLCRQRLCFIP